MAEVVEALRSTLSVPAVAAVHVLVEQEVIEALRAIVQHPKLHCHPTEAQPTYKDYFGFANERLAGEIAIIMNSDVFLARWPPCSSRLASRFPPPAPLSSFCRALDFGGVRSHVGGDTHAGRALASPLRFAPL